MDIRFNKEYPSCMLSNLAAHEFIIDDVLCASMEGFLQSLKFENEEEQIKICKLSGFEARNAGQRKNWQETQILYWQGIPYRRDSFEYQVLLDRVYLKLFDSCNEFKIALKATGNENLTHNIGKTDPMKTILTRKEFCSRLKTLRDIGSRLY